MVALLLLGIRAFARRFSNIPAVIQGFVDSFMWEESEEVQSDGVKRVVRKPSAQFAAMVQTIVPVIAPLIMQEGVKWAKTNIKFGGPGGAGGPGLDLGGLMGGAGGGIGKMLGLKGGLGKLADAFGPTLIQKFLPSLGGGAAKPAEGGASTNPFLKQ